MYSKENKEKIRSENDIIKTVERYGIKLAAKGKVFVGLCPFRSVDTPSFTVYPDTQSFYCFDCATGGDVFAFVGKKEGIGFGEVIKLLSGKTFQSESSARQTGGAGQFGKSVPPLKPAPAIAGSDSTVKDFGGKSNHGEEGGEKKKVFYEYEKVYERCYELGRKSLLEGEDAGDARAYLKDRGIPAEALAKLSIAAYTPKTRQFMCSEFSMDVLKKSGLVSYGMGYNYQIIFPHYVNGKLNGLTARLIRPGKNKDGEELPKYKHTSGLDKSAPYCPDINLSEIKKRKEAVVVEGHMDVLALSKAGIMHAVCLGGNSLSDNYIDWLSTRAQVKNIVLWFNNDDPGRDDCKKAIKTILISGRNIDVFVAHDSDVKDACDYILKNGDDAARQFIEGAALGTVWLANYIASGATSDKDKLIAVEEAREVYKHIKEPIVKNSFVKTLAKGLKFKVDDIKKSFEIEGDGKTEGGAARKTVQKVKPLNKGHGGSNGSVSRYFLEKVKNLIDENKSLYDVMEFTRDYNKTNKLSKEMKNITSLVYCMCQKYATEELKHFICQKISEGGRL